MRILQHLRGEVPIFGVNTGRVGILAHASPQEYKSALKKAIESFEIEKFPRISCVAEGEELLALNEIAFFGRDVLECIRVKLSIDEKVLDYIRCKGIIIATSVGSTAYSLSVGGPVVEPGVEAIIINVLMPLRSIWRPVLIRMDRRIGLEGEAWVIADEQKKAYTNIAEVRKSRNPAVFFKKERIPDVLLRIRTVS